jgi:hypothetical protein
MREGNVVVKADQSQIEVRRSSCVESGLFHYELLRFQETDVLETNKGTVVLMRTVTIWNCAKRAVVAVAGTDCDCYSRHDETWGYGERKD